MEPGEIRPEIGKPDIRPVERSPLLAKARCMAEMLRQENMELEKYLASVQDRSRVSVEEVDANDTEVVQMTLCMGVVEANYERHQAAPLDDTPLPTEWRKATTEK